ncbi:MAG: T9SS type A sorting domain-containing protein [Bacteroidales bacterium]|nr:T9SS type A sorting domain-containing protein [Bacteroidales bacterium]
MSYTVNDDFPTDYGFPFPLRVYNSNDTVLSVDNVGIGNYAFRYTKLKDGLGCSVTNSTPTTPIAVVRVRAVPTVKMEDLVNGKDTICLGEEKTLNFIGEPDYKLTYWDNKWGKNTLDISSAKKMIKSLESGQFEFKLLELEDAFHCIADLTDTINNTLSASIYVRPKPSVSMAAVTVCKNDSVTITLIGIPPFTLDYTVNNGSGAVDASVYHLPKEFGAGKYPITQTGETAYTAKIEAGEAGDFEFVLKSIKDYYCLNDTLSDSTVNITVNELPLVKITPPLASVCENANITLSFEKGKAPYTLTYKVDNDDPSKVGLPSPIVFYNANGSGDTTIKAGSAGTFIFDFVSLTDANGCTGTSNVNNFTVIVDAPTVTVDVPQNNELCAGEGVNFTFTGNYPVTLKYLVSVDNGVNWLNPSQVYLPSAITFYGANAKNDTTIIAGSAGTFKFRLLGLTDNKGCSGHANVDNFEITVNPLPTVTMANQDICYKAPATVKVTAKKFPVDIQFKTKKNGVWVGGNASDGSDATIFNRHIAETEVNPLDNTVSIASADYGEFEFHLISITDNNGCVNTTAQTAKVIVKAPTVSMSGLTDGKDIICIGESKELVFTGTGNFDIAFTSRKDDASKVDTFYKRGISSPYLVPSMEAGKFEFTLLKVTDNGTGCENTTPVTATILVHALPTVQMLGLTNGNDTICQGDSKLLQFTGVGPFDIKFTSTKDGGSTETYYKRGITENPYPVPSLALGTFDFTLLSVFDHGTGCENTTPVTAQITVKGTAPTVEMLNMNPDGRDTICIGENKYLQFTGTAPFDIEFTSKKDGAFVNTFYKRVITENPYKVESLEAGEFEFTLLRVTDATGCENTTPVTASVFVNSRPTVSMPSSAVCKNDSVTITFTGTPPFTLDYTVNSADPSTAYHLPKEFGAGKYPITQTGATEYTAKIEAGEAGQFIFALESVEDANCINDTDQIVNITVNALPTVEMADMNPDGRDTICIGKSKELQFTGTGPFDIEFTSKKDGQLVGTFYKRGITNNHSVISEEAGEFEFVLTKVTDNSTGCVNTTPVTATVLVNALPTVTMADMNPNGTDTICIGESKDLVFTGVGPFDIEFTSTKDGQLVGTFYKRGITDKTYPVLSDEAGKFEFTLLKVTDHGTGCENTTPVTATVLVNALPTVQMADMNPDGRDTICIGASKDLVFTGTGPFDIEFTSKKDGQLVGTFYKRNIGSPYSVQSDEAGEFEFTLLKVTDRGTGCENTTPITATILVNALPTVQMLDLDNGKDTVCMGESKVLEFTGIAPYNLVFRSNGVEYSKNNITTNTLAVPSEQVGLFGFKLVSLTDASGCGFDAANSTDTATIFVHEMPTVSMEDQDLCYGDSATIKVKGTPPFNIAFNTLRNGVLTGSFNQTVLADEIYPDGTVRIASKDTGTYVFTLESITDANCINTGLSASATVRVNAAPSVRMLGLTDGKATICFGESMTLVFTGVAPYNLVFKSNGVEYSKNNIMTDTLAVPSEKEGNFVFELVSLTDASGCDYDKVNSMSTAEVYVRSLPELTIVTKTLCMGDSVTLNYTGTTPWGFTYNDGTSDKTLSGITSSEYKFKSALTGTFAITSVSDVYGCVVNITNGDTITVNPLPTAEVVSNQTFCLGDSVELVKFTGAASWTLLYNDGVNDQSIVNNTDTSFIFKPTTAGTYTFNLKSVSDANCSNSLNGNVTVIVNPLPTASIVASRTLCLNDSLELINLTGKAPWTLVYNDGTNNVTETVASSPYVFKPTTTGSHVFTLVSVSDANNCVNTTLTGTATITVNPLPTATIALAADTTICAADEVALINLTGTQPWTVTYNNGASNVTVQNITVSPYKITPTATATYTLVSVSDANCTGTVDLTPKTITVNPLPTVTVIAANSTICSGDSVAIVSVTGGTIPWTLTYNTNQTLTTSSSLFWVKPTATTTYNLVSVGSNNGCSVPVTGSIVITVNAVPTAALLQTTPATMCLGDSTDIVTITGGTAPWTITYNDGTGVQTVSVATSPYRFKPTTARSYTVTLTGVSDANGCTGTVSGAARTITVNPLPTVAVIAAANSTICSGDSVAIVSVTGGTGPWTLTYNTNQTLTTSSSLFWAKAAGTYTLNSVSSNNGCSVPVTGSVTITVNTPPTAALQQTTPAIMCLGDSTNLVTITGGTAPWTITYNDGTGVQTVSVATSPYWFKPTTARSYTVTLTGVSDANGCKGTVSGAARTITVNSRPAATVIASSQTICSGDSVAIVSVSGGTGPWTLTYNTNQTLTTSSSLFWIKPTATTTYNLVSAGINSGCSVPVTGSVVITVNTPPTATTIATASNQSICLGDSIAVATISGSGTPWTLTYNDGTGIAKTVSGITTSPYYFKPAVAGTYNFTLVSVTTVNGCKGSIGGSTVTNIMVNPNPTAMIIAQDQSIYAGDSVALISLTGTAPWTVYYNTNQTLTATSSLFWAKVAGTYALDSVNSVGCTSPATGNVTITVNPKPTATQLPLPSTICLGESVDYVSLTGTAPWTLTYNDGTGVQTVLVNTSPYKFNPTVDRTYALSLISVSDVNGYAGTLINASTETITVNPLPTAVLASNQTITLGQSVNLITLTGVAPWDVVYSDGQRDVTESVNTSPYVFTPTVADVYTFTLRSVTDANGCTNTITGMATVITVNAVVNNDASLVTLTVSEGTLDPVFDANTVDYIVNVSYEIDSITIFAQSTDPNATVTGIGRFELRVGVTIFHVTVTAEDGLTTQVYTVAVYRNSVGIEMIEVSESINVYPNPTRDILYVVSDLQIKQIDIYDINGKVVKQIINPEQSISVSELSRGIYMLQIQTDRGVAIKKVTKQ